MRRHNRTLPLAVSSASSVEYTTDIMEPAYKKQRRCSDEKDKSHEELRRALAECRAQLDIKTQLANQLQVKVTSLETRVAELEAIYEWQGS